MRILLLLLALAAIFPGYAEEEQSSYSTLFDRWNESVKAEIYSGNSVIRGDPSLLKELRQRAHENLPFLRKKVGQYFFAGEIMSHEALGLPINIMKTSERYVPIAWYDPAATGHRGERAGGLLLFHSIRALSSVPDSTDSVTLSVPASKVIESRRLIEEAIDLGEFSISILREVKANQ